MKGNISTDGHWWSYDAYCDECGKHYQDQRTVSTEKPDINEPDYCYTCLVKMIHTSTLVKLEETNR